MGGPRSSFRPFLTGGVALAHNIYRDELQYSGVYTDQRECAGLQRRAWASR